jgi:calcineurin-like phosphoesterase family protein
MNSTEKILEIVDSSPSIKEEMQRIHFTADLHHSHPKIIDICNRPVYVDYEGDKSLKNREYKELLDQAHNEWLVKEVFNKHIGKNHTVYILGDVSMDKKTEAEKFIDRLNGNKFLIIGNHDKNIHNSTRFSQITQIKDFSFSRGGLNIHIALCHYPLASWNRKPHGAWHLYGHVHGRYKNSGLSLDVGIDNAEIGWKPINLYQVALMMAEKESQTVSEGTDTGPI